jgi:hypothetical protein
MVWLDEMSALSLRYKKFKQSMRNASERGDRMARLSVFLGIAGVLATAVGLAADVPNLAGAGVVIGVVAIIIARIARRRAVVAQDDDRASLSRYGQIMGWLAVAPFLVLLVIVIVLAGSLILFFTHVS